MKSTSLTILFAATLLACSTSMATTTLRFAVTGTNRATGFSDNLGVAGINNMRWGILIDTNGGGFQAGSYDLFNSATSGFLSASTLATDDYYFTPGTLPVTANQTATGIDPGGDGGIVSAAGAPNGTDGIIPGVTTGDPFAIIWFATTPNANGTYYGVFTHPSFLLPASGSFADFNTPFLGGIGDPIKPASFVFGVPEPSRLMLLGLGAVGLIFRRRRN